VTGVGVTRERLVRAASSAVMRRGVHGSGLAEICGRAGVTKGVFSHHFPGGKEQLVAEVIDRKKAELVSVLGGLQHQSAAERVRGLFANYADRLRRNGTELGCPVAAAVVDASAQWPRVRDAARAAFAEWSTELGCDDGVGELVVAALEGAILQARAQDDPDAVDRIGNTLADLLAGTGASGAAS
jgi:TetR/AcrR family transcriptional repressor of lmrAB and yxaGH operons